MDSQNKKLEIQGKLSKYSCAELFAEISQAKFSGALRVSSGEQKVISYFDEGKVVYVVSNLRKHRLFQILLSENAIAKEKLLKIEGFANDLHLSKKLTDEEFLTKDIVDSIFSMQINQILHAVWSWDSGEWSFSPLTRIKEGIRFDINLHSLLGNYSNTLKNEDILNRFKSVDESFSVNSNTVDFSSMNSSPSEAFVFSRIGEDTLTIDELRSMSGLPNDELFEILYRLWLGGTLKRRNWNAVFKDDDIAKIGDAKVVLKKSTTSFEEEQEKARIIKENQLKAEEEARLEAEKEVEKHKKKELTLDQYLKRVDDAATHYELFDIAPEAEISKIKKVYFSYAKNFHPDLFHKKVKDQKHQQIQKAFTEIARAYDTLKDEDAREVYDFKLRKVIEASRKYREENSTTPADFDEHKNAEAALSQFENGYDLLMKGDYKTALPFLERAVLMDKENARFHAYFGKALSNDKAKRHKAEAELQLAIKLNKDSTVYRMILAKIYIKIGLPARAKGELNKILKMAPNDSDAISLLDTLSNP